MMQDCSHTKYSDGHCAEMPCWNYSERCPRCGASGRDINDCRRTEYGFKDNRLCVIEGCSEPAGRELIHCHAHVMVCTYFGVDFDNPNSEEYVPCFYIARGSESFAPSNVDPNRCFRHEATLR